MSPACRARLRLLRPFGAPPILLLLACGSPSRPGPALEAPAPDLGGVVLRSGTGGEVGRVSLRQAGDRVVVRVRVNGLPSGLHGMHLHEIGRCQPPGFQSAGPHWNPGGRRSHGQENPRGPHPGDLGNLSVGEDGRGERTAEITGLEASAGIRAVLGGLGRALVIHANPDDERTDPAGNTGPRLACAAITP